MADSWDSVILIVISLAGITIILFNLWRCYEWCSRVTKAIHIYKCVALSINVALHVRQIQKLPTDNFWFMIAVLMVISAVTMRAFIDTGEGSRL